MKSFQSLDTNFADIKCFLLLFIAGFLFWQSCTQKPLPRSAEIPKLISGKHYDEGPANRYGYPYEPITYNQKVLAPLPGLYYCFKMVDWDHDGLIDILGLARRGGGLRFIKNIGDREMPLYRSLHENLILMESGQFNRWFNVIDFNEDGDWDLIGWYVDPYKEVDIISLNIYLNVGTPAKPVWDTLTATYPDGSMIQYGGRIEIGDWDDDGKDDIILGRSNMGQILKADIDSGKDHYRRAKNYGGFRDTSAYNPEVGELFFLKNMTSTRRRPVFSYPKPILVDGKRFQTYVGLYPSIYDLDKDGLNDVVLGSQKPGLIFLKNIGSKGNPQLSKAGTLKNINGEYIFSSFALRFEEADLNGDGVDDFVTGAYFGNQDRFLLYTQQNEITGFGGWKFDGYLSINASHKTPIYGAGNSSVDPVDWDNDGDLDLLLGSEPCMPTILINVGSDRNRRYQPAERLKFVDGRFLETYSVETGDGSHWGPLEWYSDRLAPRARDWDGDGILDLISGSMGKRVYFFKGAQVDGELRFHAPANFQYEGKDFIVPDRQFPEVIDYDRDGWMDLIVNNPEPAMCLFYGNGTIKLEDPIKLKHPDGSLIQPQDHWNRTQGNRMGMTIFDWDLDRKPDLIVYRFHEGIYFYKGVDKSTFQKGRRLVSLFSHMAGCSVIDWDHNGIPDLLVGGDERRMIEVDRPGQVVVFYGEDTDHPPEKSAKLIL
jgi:hypothetical protein